MSANWPVVRLGDHIDSSLGKMLDKKKNKGTEQIYLGNSDVRWGYFDLMDLSQMKFEDTESDRYGIKNEDLIVCEGGEPGRCAIWKEEIPDMKIQKALHRVRPKLTLSNYYLYYWFLFSGSRGLLEPYFTGTTIKHLTGKALKDLEIQLPPLDHQEGVVRVLKSLDDKIELNRQTNQTLESIAQAIFKSWFVDFEPTRAKIAAKQNGQDPERAAMAAISGKTITDLNNLPPEQQQSLKSTAALFPDTLTDSEIGQIPEGWDETTLGDHFDVVMGQSPKGDTYNEDGNGMLFFQGRRDFGFRYPTPRVYTTAPKRLAQNGDTLISVRAPVGDRNMASQECCLGRGVAGIRHKSGARSFTYAFIGHIEKNLSDSGSDGTVFSSINKNELNAVGFVAPTKDIVILYEEKISSLDQQVEVNSKEIETLESLRDTLLPKLLSGELTMLDLTCFNRYLGKGRNMQ